MNTLVSRGVRNSEQVYDGLKEQVVFSAMHSYIFQLKYQHQLIISPDKITIPTVIYWKAISKVLLYKLFNKVDGVNSIWLEA